MVYSNFIRRIVKKHPELKLKLKKAGSTLTPFQYVHQSISLTIMSQLVLMTFIFIFFKSNFSLLLLLELFSILLGPLIIFKFFFGYVDVLIQKYGRDLDSDLLFVSEYILVTLESGLPLGNVIQQLSKIDRPGGRFFKRIYQDFKTGKDLESALRNAESYAPTESVKILIKRLSDSLKIGVNLKSVLENFISEASEKKFLEIKTYSKKLNPLVMIYLLLGIVLPSLGITFLILGVAVISNSSSLLLLKVILSSVFLFMFTFQYLSYTLFKFSKTII